MNRWLVRNRKELEDLVEELKKELIKNSSIKDQDILYVYTDDTSEELFNLRYKFLISNDGKSINLDKKEELNKTIDIPYTLYYKTKKANEPAIVNDEYLKIFFNEELSVVEEDIRKRFAIYVETQPLATKKITSRIKYLDELLPNKINVDNPISIFEIRDEKILENLRTELSSGGKYHEWDRKGSYSGEILQTLNMYISFLNDEKSKKNINIEVETNENDSNNDENSFKSFLNKINPKQGLKIHSSINNIDFVIGQPNTGKSYHFEEKQIFNNGINNNDYKYLKIPVSGGIGNEYKGLQSTDLAITYDPIKKEIRFGEFLQILMSAIVNPNIPHVIFLDDFHNQDISSLLSEYTPLFKSQQKRDIPNIDSSNEIFNQTFSSTDEFIKIWNKFIKEHCLDIPKVPITNRISGESLYLVYPSNFYLLGAANFNANTLNIFADWEDRARITYKDPIETFTLSNDDAGFVECCKELNTKLRSILENKDIFDYEKYCFGMWKIVEPDGNPISDPSKQKDIFRFLFGMIKNSLRFNNKNSLINTIGKSLFIEMQSNDWFRSNIKEINQDLEDKVFFKILHTYNIYEEDI